MRPAERPVYGGLNLLDHPDGACPRFGSCHLLLRPAVLARTTFAFGDSHLRPRDVGTVDVFEPVLAALLTTTADTGTGLGVPVDLVTLVAAVLRRHEAAVEAAARFEPDVVRSAGRALDDYVEAQVHGEVDLARDVEALVVDPSFDGTQTGAALDRLARRPGVPLRRHAGFALGDPQRWADRGPTEVTLQHLKQLWHVLVRYGTPRAG